MRISPITWLLTAHVLFLKEFGELCDRKDWAVELYRMQITLFYSIINWYPLDTFTLNFVR